MSILAALLALISTFYLTCGFEMRHVSANGHNLHRPNYRFNYGVNDQKTGDIKSAHEERQDGFAKGGYAFLQPDGLYRIVEYTSHPVEGFKATVHYRKELNAQSQPPPPSTHSPAPSPPPPSVHLPPPSPHIPIKSEDDDEDSEVIVVHHVYGLDEIDDTSDPQNKVSDPTPPRTKKDSSTHGSSKSELPHMDVVIFKS